MLISAAIVFGLWKFCELVGVQNRGIKMLVKLLSGCCVVHGGLFFGDEKHVQ
jgi:hypothetical protein